MTDRNPSRSGYLTRLDTRLGTFAGTSLVNPGTVAAPAFSGVIDNMIAGGGRAPRVAFSVSHRLYTTYTGPLFRASLVDGTSAEDFGYGADNRLDEAAMVAHFGASNAYIDTPYEQSGNARDITQATLNRRPKIYDGATQSVVKQGTLPWPTFTGLSTNATHWARGDSVGITGAVAVSHAFFGAATSFVAFSAMIGIGSGGTQRFVGGVAATTGDPTNHVGSGAQRSFTPLVTPATPSLLIHAIGAGQQVGASACSQDGTALVESAVAGGTNTATISNTGYAIGSLSGANVGFNGWGGGACFWMSDDIAWSGGALAALVAFGAELEALS